MGRGGGQGNHVCIEDHCVPSPGPVLIGTQRWRELAPGPAGGFRLPSEATQLDKSIRHYLKKDQII